MYWTFQYQLHDRLEDKLPHIQAPVLVVRGARDPICNQHWCEEIVRLLPRGAAGGDPRSSAHAGVYRTLRVGMCDTIIFGRGLTVLPGAIAGHVTVSHKMFAAQDGASP